MTSLGRELLIDAAIITTTVVVIFVGVFISVGRATLAL